MTPCPCSKGSSVHDLVTCLAPPPGDYEVVLEGFAGASVVINDEGIWVRSVTRDEWLPFMESRDRPASSAALEQALRLNNLSWEGLLCMVAQGLVEAARHGSLRARRRLEACRELVAEVLSRCGEGLGDLQV